MKNVLKAHGFVLVSFIFLFLGIYSCSKDNAQKGSTDPSSIAASSLVAYFPFDKEGEDVQYSNGSITWSRKGGAASFVPGRRGNAYQGSTSEAYLEYNVASDNPFRYMNEFTIAAWVKSPGNTDGHSRSMFNLNGGDVFMHNIDLLQESGLGDSLKIKFYMYSDIAPVWKGHDTLKQARPFLNDQWFHLVVLYNKTTSTIEFYADGKKVHSSVQYGGPRPSSGSQPLLGPMQFEDNISKIVIGAWPQQVSGTPDPWMAYFNGMIDELRIYNKALSPSEIQDLYKAELSNVN